MARTGAERHDSRSTTGRRLLAAVGGMRDRSERIVGGAVWGARAGDTLGALITLRGVAPLTPVFAMGYRYAVV